MKTRHAAALALVGWYLMVSQQWDNDALRPPLAKWEIVDSFDSAHACEAARHEMAQMAAEKDKDYPSWVITGRFERLSQCVATDDPRLKGK